MTAAFLLAIPAILAIAAATPRQADQISRSLNRSRRFKIRTAGLCLLCLSFAITLSDPDRTRAIIGWVGVTGVEAITIALIFTLIASRAPRS